MIWATVNSWSCFSWLYRASLSLVAKNIINLISVSTIWWCPCVKSFLVLLEEGVCYDQCVSWQNSISLCPASFRIPSPNLPVTPGVSWLPTFAFQSPIMKRTSFGGVNSRRSCRSCSQLFFIYLDSILKTRDITLPTKVRLVKAMGSSCHVWMWELDHKESWAPKNWCFWTVVFQKTLESPLDSKEIKSVNPKGNQS